MRFPLLLVVYSDIASLLIDHSFMVENLKQRLETKFVVDMHLWRIYSHAISVKQLSFELK